MNVKVLFLDLLLMFSQEQKNGIELYVSSDRTGASEPVSSEEVIRSLNINTLHSSLGSFGITEVSAEVCVLESFLIFSQPVEMLRLKRVLR